MRTFIEHYLGYAIYRWSTGKYEAYLDDQPTGLAAHTLVQLETKIDIAESLGD